MEKLRQLAEIVRLKVTQSGRFAYIHWSDQTYLKMRVERIVTQTDEEGNAPLFPIDRVDDHRV